MDLIATKSLVYASKRREVGEQFEANSRDARILVAIGKAKAADATKARAETKSVVADAKANKRAYKRRDMKAE
mgnify:CR=1 FL=1